MSGESESVSTSWNAGLSEFHDSCRTLTRIKRVCWTGGDHNKVWSTEASTLHTHARARVAVMTPRRVPSSALKRHDAR